MKMKKFLASVLALLMTASSMSFAATVSAENTGIIKESVLNTNWQLERGDNSAKKAMYDEETGIGYMRLVPTSDTTTHGSSSCYINIGSQEITFTKEQAESGECYIVLYARTNMTLDENDTLMLNQYTCYWGEASKTGYNPTATHISEDFGAKISDEWQKFCFKLKTSAEYDFDKDEIKETEYLSKWNQVAFFPVNAAKNKPISEWWSSVAEGETPYVDFAGYAVVDSLSAAKAYSFTESAAAPKVEVKFDKGYTAGDDTDVETAEYVSGKYKTANVVFPELTAPSGDYDFVGWYTDAEFTNKIEDTTAVAVGTENAAYYALWQDNSTPPEFALESVTVNGTALTEFSIDGVNVTLPYGWAELEKLGVSPVIEATAGSATVEYVAGESLAAGGTIKLTQGSYSKNVPVTIVIADAPSDVIAGTDKITAGVKSSGTFNDADGNQLTSTYGEGLVAEKNVVLEGVTANKFTPVYAGGEYDGVKKSENVYYTSEKSVNLEAYNAFGKYDFESYAAIRALVYVDKGKNGTFDVTPNSRVTYQASSTTGTIASDAAARKAGSESVNDLVGGRWEYLYFTKPAALSPLYGKVIQPVFQFFSEKDSTLAKQYTDDVFYFAEATLLKDVPEFVQYKPTGLTVTEIDGDTSGSISGLNGDMEMLVGEEWTKITEVANYADGVLSNLEVGEYSFRYAATETLLASEAVVLEITPDSVEIYFEDGDATTNVVEQSYEYNEAITAPEAPAKVGHKFLGWALGNATEAYDFTAATATADLDGATFNALWERVTTLYVNGSAETSGDGFTAETAMTTLADAWALVSDINSTIIITGDTELKGNLHANGGNVVIKGATGAEVLTHKNPSFNGKNEGKVTFEDITIINPTQWSNFWNFYGMGVEFGENVTVPVDAENNKWPIVARAGGESGATLGRKIVIRSGEFSTFHLGSKTAVDNKDVDFELFGGNVAVNLGNDSVENQTVETHSGTMQNIRALFEVKPASVYMQWIHTMTGALQLIANNGVDLGTINMNGVVPAGGTWRINSAEGGRADFTATAGKFQITTKEAYIIVTDKATDSQRIIRASDGVEGEANLFGSEKVYLLTLEAGVYDISYTSAPIDVTVVFENGDADETYSLAKGGTAYFQGTVNAPAGKVFAGWATEDGAIKLSGNEYTADTYSAEDIVFYPVFEDDATKPYYYAYGEYDSLNGTYTATVKIANGKFAAGTLGVTFDKSVLTYKGYTLGEGISNNLGTEPAIVSENMFDGEDDKFVIVWDAAQGVIDASAEQVAIVTFEFDVLDAENIENAADYLVPTTEYAKYFNGEYYLVSPENTSDNPYAVEYVPVYFGDTVNKEKSYEKATITFNVTFDSKAGATNANVGELVVYKDGAEEIKYTIDAAGNENATVTQVVEDFYVGEEFYFYVHKNGYISVDVLEKAIEAKDMTIDITLLAGDIKSEEDDCCGDGEITLSDFVRVVRAFDDTATEEYRTYVDLNEDGSVSVTDLAIIKTNFGKTEADNSVDVIEADENN